MYTNNQLYHHGIKGMKWGVRRFQNPDGSLTAAGKIRYGREVRKIEKTAIKERRKKTGDRFSRSTGENYDKALKSFDNALKNDKAYKDLSKKAFDAEKKRLLYERDELERVRQFKGRNKDEFDTDLDEQAINEAYDNLYREDKKYKKLFQESVAATEAKQNRHDEIAEKYYDIVKEAKLKDLNITKNKELAKKYLRKTYLFYDDENLEYNPDTWYEPGDEKIKFKK